PMPSDPPPAEAPDALVAAQVAVADLFGDIAAFWGFPRSQGRVFGMLIVAGPRPVPQREIRRVLGLSAGGASMALSSLGRWGAVRRTDHGYVAETDLWRIITGVFDQRERAQVDGAIARLVAARDALIAAGDPTDPACALALARMQRLLEFFRAGRAFLDAFVHRGPLHGLLDIIARRAARLPTATGDVHVHIDA
ncbi:MAG: hypothetical protein D6705_14430, partial [Deltaproteobacteria bacterium]